ncbi:MAG: selenocysteine-specific translation elongation factor [Candidatus Sericytochromatia bacterium]|nr:selenocysteine-specific translation elongation factor [Candidatus Sericytochromatia bacterium]
MTDSLRLTIGTAGHVDHGKTSLVKALTGIDTDRWDEEKRRGMTIDLGFASWDLPNGRRAALVDVPGHERFLKNMLAGVTGLDLVMLVVAADDGMMPQTREHLDILDLLQVQNGLVVLTKTDLVDPELLALAEEDVRLGLAGTFLADAPILPVSTLTGAGLVELVQAIEALTADTAPRPTEVPPRMAVDRVFTRPGFGTVVTGTMLAGRWHEGDTVDVWPGDLSARIRGIQVHGDKVPVALAGQRVALNLSGLERHDLQRGAVVGAPGTVRTSDRLAVRVSLLADHGLALSHRDRVRVHVGTAEAIGRVVLLDADLWPAGGGGDAVIELESPIAVDFGDRFILRRYSPMVTLGGGIVLHPAVGRLRRRHAPTLARLAAYAAKDCAAVLQALMTAAIQAISREAVLQELPYGGASALAELLEQGNIVELPGIGLVHAQQVALWQAAVMAALQTYLRDCPWRLGVPREAVIGATKLAAAVIDWLAGHLRQSGQLSVHGALYVPAGHQPLWPKATEAVWSQVQSKLDQDGLVDTGDLTKAFPTIAEHIPAYVFDLTATGALIALGQDITVTRPAWDRLLTDLRRHFPGPFTTSQAREALGISRRFAIPLLETCDQRHLTRRQGDLRTFAKP